MNRSYHYGRLLLASSLAIVLLATCSLSAEKKTKDCVLDYNFEVKGITQLDCGVTINGPIQLTSQALFANDLAISPDNKLLLNEMNPVQLDGDNNPIADDLGTICVSGNLAVAPGKTLYVNDINPVTLDEDGKCVADENGLTTFSGGVEMSQDLTVDGSVTFNDVLTVEEHTTINNGLDVYQHSCFHNDLGLDPDATLFTNYINPSKLNVDGDCVADDSVCAATCFSGDVCIRNQIRFGENPNVYLNQNNPTNVLNLVFGNTTSSVYNSNLARGARVKIKFFGTGEYTPVRNGLLYFDVFYEVDLFVSPGLSGDGQSGVIGTPITRFGHTGDVATISAQLTNIDASTVGIQLNVNSYGGDTIQYLQGVVFYEVCSDNLDSIQCPNSNT